MTYEEAYDSAIEGLKLYEENFPDLKYQIEFQKLVVKAFDKQIKKKPKTRYGIIYYCPPDCGGKEFDEYGDILICPSCGKDIENDKYCKHCKECGQALDWRKE